MAKKRHHTVSYFLLDRFARDTAAGRRICQLEKWTGVNKQVSPRDATIYKHFYSIEVGGERVSALEDALGQIEGMSAGLVRKLDHEDSVLIGQDRLDFAAFFAFTWLRTPFWRERFAAMTHHLMAAMTIEMLQHPDPYRRFLERIGEHTTEEQVETQRLELLEWLERGEYEIVSPQNLLIKDFLEAAANVTWIVYMLDWAIVRVSPGREFVIGDAPVSLYDPEPMAPGGAVGLLSSPYAGAFLPLSPKIGLLVTANEEIWRFFAENGERLREMNEDERLHEISGREGGWADGVPTGGFLEMLNLMTYAHAQRYIFGSQKAVCDLHALAKRRRAEIAALTPRPPSFHLVEDDPNFPGGLRVKRTITAG